VKTDRGQADPRVTETLGGYWRGEISEHQMLGVLRESRVLVPIVAVAAVEEAGEAGGETEKQTDMAMPKLVGKDGQAAMMAYTSLDAMRLWDATARPVPMPLSRACQAALAEDCALVIDVGGPVQVSLQGPRLAALASGQPVPPPHEDPEIIQTVAAIAAGATLRTADHGGLVVELAATSHEEATRTARQIVAVLGQRLRRIDVQTR
jgi:SseB protein N-terminal domain